MRGWVTLAALALAIGACSPGDLEFVAEVPVATGDVTKAAAADIIANRLEALSAESYGVEVTPDGLLIEVPEDTDPGLIDLILAPGAVSMHRVVGVYPDETAAAAAELGEEEMLVDDDIGMIYQVGPAFIGPDGFVDGRVETLQAPEGMNPVVVDPVLTDEAAAVFVETTKTLAGLPVGPGKQIAIVIDDHVLSAPQLAAEVDPAQGLPADSIVFTIQEGPMIEERARALAAYLRFGPLPVPLARSRASNS